MQDKSKLIKNIVTAGILLAIIIVMQLLKNVVPALVSGSIINVAMIVATINIGIWWGVGFSVITPVLSILFAWASPMTALTISTYGLNIPIIALGNVIMIVLAWLGYRFYRNEEKIKKKPIRITLFIVSLALGAILKWLFMWGSSVWIIEPIFKDKLDKPQIQVLNNLFSLTQLIAGSISVPVTFFVQLSLDRFYHRY